MSRQEECHYDGEEILPCGRAKSHGGNIKGWWYINSRQEQYHPLWEEYHIQEKRILFGVGNSTSREEEYQLMWEEYHMWAIGI